MLTSHLYCMPVLLSPILAYIMPTGSENQELFEELNAHVRVKRDCPMSPYATFLTMDQQQTLHELITEARGRGADEDAVKKHIDKYLKEILPAKRLTEFHKENEKFEKLRASRMRGKRAATNGEKRKPQRVFDLIDFYSNEESSPLMKFYSDVSTKKLRQLH